MPPSQFAYAPCRGDTEKTAILSTVMTWDNQAHESCLISPLRNRLSSPSIACPLRLKHSTDSSDLNLPSSFGFQVTGIWLTFASTRRGSFLCKLLLLVVRSLPEFYLALKSHLTCEHDSLHLQDLFPLPLSCMF